MEQAEPLPLSRLRADLELSPGPRDLTGQTTWVIHDPLRNRYHKISRAAVALLNHWHLGEASAVQAAVGRATGDAPSIETIRWLDQFLRGQMLHCQETGPQTVETLRTIAEARHMSWYRWLLHNYLFMRLPLVRPQRFLEATQGIVGAIVSPPALALLALAALSGLFLVTRQWEAFVGTFLHFFTLDGLLYYAAALGLAKVVHELGHAYAAVRQGLRVPTMGVALLVLWPVLYTDTSDAWRLQSKKGKIAIGAAGMAAELWLAILATLLWSFLPDGALRSACFLIATVTWIMTLAINLNPFMRFDGYYLLSDALGIENLQQRSFERAKWWLRRTVLGLAETPPEPLPGRLGTALVAYAFGTWIYRFFLFLGIALLVYAMFFKVLGIFLFAVEVLWFIVLPVTRELQQWWSLRKQARLTPTSLISLGALFALMALFLVPWDGRVHLPALLDTTDQTIIFAPSTGQIAEIDLTDGMAVREGQVLLRLKARSLDHKLAQAALRIEETRLLLKREAAAATFSRQARIQEQALARHLAERDALVSQEERLSLSAPRSGELHDLNRNLKPGVWVNDQVIVGRLLDPMRLRVIAYIPEASLSRIEEGAAGYFIPDDPSRSRVPVTLIKVSPTSAHSIAEVALTSLAGGPIGVEASGPTGEQKGQSPVDAQFRLELAPATEEALTSQIRGTVILDAERESWASMTLRRIGGVLVRESGF
ncbi:MAG: HlyD family efflux transporter periplasmic adaptor subunit [Magnetovibrionaceae bacterium]